MIPPLSPSSKSVLGWSGITGVPVATSAGALRSRRGCKSHLSSIHWGWPCSSYFPLILPMGPAAELCPWDLIVAVFQLIFPQENKPLKRILCAIPVWWTFVMCLHSSTFLNSTIEYTFLWGQVTQADKTLTCRGDSLLQSIKHFSEYHGPCFELRDAERQWEDMNLK